MNKKIFASYKYADNSVYDLDGDSNTTVRTYVDKFEEKLGNNIFKGEKDGEDLSELSEDVIWNKLRDRIYDSTLTVIFISPNMKESTPDREQWIPWEISYSLKEPSRHDQSGNIVTSKTNALLAVVLPDKAGLYSYYLEEKTCCESGCILHNKDSVFDIISDNKYNYINGKNNKCKNGNIVWLGTTSYIYDVKWDSFSLDVEKYINIAYVKQANIDDYRITKEIE